MIRKNQIITEFAEAGGDIEVCALLSQGIDPSINKTSNDQRTDPKEFCFDIDETLLKLEQIQQVKDLLMKNSSLFPPDNAPIGRAKGVEHKIDTGNALPIKTSLRRVSPQDREILGKEMESMLDKQLVIPSLSPWDSPVVIVKKKDQTYRVRLDFRRLNITRKDPYPIPRMDDSLDSLGGARYFSASDLASGYWQVPVAADNTPFGLFECLTMPFLGYVIAPPHFREPWIRF